MISEASGATRPKYTVRLMRIAYLDCFSGISGAMTLAALLQAGADLDGIGEALNSLPSTGFDIEVEEVEAHGIAALRTHVRSDAAGVIRTYASIRALLDEGDLPDSARRASQRAFRLLAEADARVHGRELELVTFHDLGDIDPIAAIVGTAIALDQLGVERVFASPVPTGMGMVRTEHGMAPIPSPVVVSLLRGVPTFSRGIPAELATPVGAALLASLVEGYGDMPMMRTEAVGYGAGTLRLDFPHVLRVVIGPEERGVAGVEPARGDLLLLARAAVTPEEAMGAAGRVLSAGARDVWAIPAVGPEGRPGAVLHAVVGHDDLPGAMEALRTVAGAGVRIVGLRLSEDAVSPGADDQPDHDQENARQDTAPEDGDDPPDH